MSAASEVLIEVDRCLMEIRCGLYAMQELARTGEFRRGECPEADNVQQAVQWIADRLAEQVEAATAYAEKQERALR